MLAFIWQTIWFFFPAGIANIAASLSRFIPILDYPVDFGKTWRGKRIFGSHKTWRGIVFGIVFAWLWFWGQQWAYQFDFFREYSIIDYSEASPWIGIMLGFGAVWGDAIRSFFKRRRNIKPGASWMPFDQIDYTVGAYLAVSIVYFPGWKFGVSVVTLGFLMHVLFNLLGYALKLQKNKF